MKTLQECVLLPCHDGHAQWGEIISEKRTFLFQKFAFSSIFFEKFILRCHEKSKECI